MGLVMEPGYPNLLVHFHFTLVMLYLKTKKQKSPPTKQYKVIFFQMFSFALCVFEAFITILKSSPMMTIPHVDVEDQEEQETVVDSLYPLHLVLYRETSLN